MKEEKDGMERCHSGGENSCGFVGADRGIYGVRAEGPARKPPRQGGKI